LTKTVEVVVGVDFAMGVLNQKTIRRSFLREMTKGRGVVTV
jgi:hypothetical protein